MDFFWLGHSCFRFKGKQATLVTDPFAPPVGGANWPRPTAQVVTVSHNHAGHNNASEVEGHPKIISGPGEYEVAGIFIVGFPSFHDAEEGKRLGKNTVYLIEIDGVRLCHLGDLGHALSPQQVEAVGTVDVLLVPVGGVSSLGPVAAAQTVRQLEPRLVVPMHYKAEGPSVPRTFGRPDGAEGDEPLKMLDKFAHEMGLKPQDPVPRLSITRANLPGEARLVVFSPSK